MSYLCVLFFKWCVIIIIVSGQKKKKKKIYTTE